MPVRDGMKNPSKHSYAVPTDKLDRPVPMVHCEGPNERDYATLLEYDPMVVSYEEQPCTIEYIFNRKKRLYTPDFAVYWHHQQPSLVECKPASKLADPENLQKWTAARLWCGQHHYTFMIVTDVALRQCGCLLANIKLLAGHGHQSITSQAREYLLRIVQSESRALSIAELVERVQSPHFTPNTIRSCIWHLIYNRELCADLTKPLNVMTTLVWCATK
jgi:hypothetical protein